MGLYNAKITNLQLLDSGKVCNKSLKNVNLNYAIVTFSICLEAKMFGILA